MRLLHFNQTCTVTKSDFYAFNILLQFKKWFLVISACGYRFTITSGLQMPVQHCYFQLFTLLEPLKAMPLLEVKKGDKIIRCKIWAVKSVIKKFLTDL